MSTPCTRGVPHGALARNPDLASGFREQRGVQQERSVEVAIATPFPEAVACSVPDLVMSIRITGDVRREHDTAGG